MIDETCDRCGTHTYLFTYGYSKVGCHLCKKCAREWEKFIMDIHVKSKVPLASEDWHKIANEHLAEFLLQTPEKVEFT